MMPAMPISARARTLGSPARAVGAACAALLFLFAPAAGAQSSPVSSPAASSPPADPPGALPYDLAFTRRTLLWEPTIAVSPDGRTVAYEVRLPPADTTTDDRWAPSGAPSSSVGARIRITDHATGRAAEVCPGGSCWRPVWSPDGTRLAFYSDADGVPRLWVYDISSRRSRRLAAAVIKPKLWVGDEPRWSPDGRTVYVPLVPAESAGRTATPVATAPSVTPANDAGVTVLTSGSEAIVDSTKGADPGPHAAFLLRENLAAIGAVDVATGRTRTLVSSEAEPRPSVFRISPSGRWVSYLSVFDMKTITSQVTSMDLALVPAIGGEVRVVATGLTVLDDYFRSNYSWHPTEDRLVYLKDGELWLVDVAGGSAPRRLGEELGELAPTVNWFTRDGRAVVVGTDPQDDKDYGDARPRGIAIVPLDGGRPTRMALDDARWRYRSIIKADERTVWQPDSASVTIVAEERSTGELAVVRLDPATGASSVLWKGLARLNELTGGGRHDVIFGAYEDLATPPDIHRFAADFASKTRVSHIEPRLDAVATGTVEVFESTVPLYDGRLEKVRTAVLLPPGAKRGDRLPAIVMMYPGSNSVREATLYGGGSIPSVPVLLFTSRGYAVVLADATLGPNREVGNPMQQLVDVVLPQAYRAAELGYVDAERLAMTGQSFGGYGTAAIVSRTNLFRAAVAISGIYDLPGTYGHLTPDGSSFWIGWSEGGQARMGTHPWGDLRRYIDNSPYYQADKIFTPMLIVHGDKDNAWHDAQKLFAALRRLDRPAQFAGYEGQGHVIWEWRVPAAVDASRRMVEFYRRHLGDPPGAGSAGDR
jgi:dipeptidyl aminopeptidase/acylaminoacyl peptidase